MANEVRGFGTTLSILEGSTYTLIGRISDVNPGGATRPTTATGNLSDDYDTHVAGGLENGTGSAVVHLDAAFASSAPNHDAIYDAFEAGSAVTLRITFANSSTRTQSAIITGFELPSITRNSAVTANISWQWTGSPTWA